MAISRRMNAKRVFLGLLLEIFTLAVGATIAHRLWLEFRHIPVSICVRRPMTQAEWEAFTKTNSQVPANFFTVDAVPYPGQSVAATVSASAC